MENEAHNSHFKIGSSSAVVPIIPVLDEATTKYWDIGDPEFQCGMCGALMWYKERIGKGRGTTKPRFSLCCSNGKVTLPYLSDPPDLLKSLLLREHRLSSTFITNIRKYNCAWAWSSLGGIIDKTVNYGRGPYTFRMGGQNVHRTGSLLPPEESVPKFCQLYIHDTEDEVNNRINVLSSGNGSGFNEELMYLLKEMIDEHNPLAKTFRRAKDRLSSDIDGDVSIRLIARRCTDGRTYNRPTASEVAALIEGDIGPEMEQRDVIPSPHLNFIYRRIITLIYNI